MLYRSAVSAAGARLVVASPEVVPAVEVPVTTIAAQSPVVAVLTPIRDAVAPGRLLTLAETVNMWHPCTAEKGHVELAHRHTQSGKTRCQ